MRKKGRHRIGQIIRHVVLILLALYTLVPLFVLVINSFKSNNEIIESPIALPKEITLSYLTNAVEQINFLRAFGVTLLVTACAVGLLVIISSISAWVMVRSKSRFAVILYLAITAAMLIPFQSVMYPLISIFEKLQLKNLTGLVIMYGGFGLSMSIFLYHGFIKSIPKSLEEAAIIDGANVFQMFRSVVFPLLKGTTVTVIVLNGMWIWNDYLLPFLVIGNSDGVKTLTLELYFARLTAGQYGNPWELIFPAVLVTIIPIILLYIFLQKYIVAGVAEGAVKM